MASDLRLRSKSNFRRSARSRQPAGAWGEFRRFEDDLSLVLRAALPVSWELGERTGPVASRPAVVAVVAAESLLDVPNFSKSVMDAAEGVVFHTDASVQFCAGLGVRARSGGLVVAFARLSPGATLREVAKAAASLTTATAAVLDPGRI